MKYVGYLFLFTRNLDPSQVAKVLRSCHCIFCSLMGWLTGQGDCGQQTSQLQLRLLKQQSLMWTPVRGVPAGDISVTVCHGLCPFSLRSAFTMHVEAGHSAVPEEGPKDLRCPLCLYHTKYKRNMIDHIVLHRGNLQMGSVLSRVLGGR